MSAHTRTIAAQPVLQLNLLRRIRLIGRPSHRRVASSSSAMSMSMSMSMSISIVTALAFATGCSSDKVTGSGPVPPRGVVVLDGFIQPGYTLLADTGSASTKLALGTSAEFDGGAFSLERDTALAVSSRGAGDLLFIADLRAGTVRKVQLPVGGNGARARLQTGGNGSTRVLVAMRDSQMVVTALIPPAGGAPTFTRIMNAGQCPVDAFRSGNATWVVDANADCRTDYTVIGPVRLIRIPDDRSERDTLSLSSVYGSDAQVAVMNDVAFVAAGGEANFGAFPYTLVRSGAIAKVDLVGRQVLAQKSMPASTYGAGLRLGLDGQLYISLYENIDTFKDRVLQLTPSLDVATTAATTAAGFRLLLDTNAGEVSCNSATADALGRVHCLIPGGAGSTTLVVFDPSGHEVRRVAAGQGGVDLALRP